MEFTRKGLPLKFIDDTVRPPCRTQQNERMIYDGNKRIHATTFQPVVTPNGLIAMLDGPYEGRKHDSGVLTDSVLLIK